VKKALISVSRLVKYIVTFTRVLKGFEEKQVFFVASRKEIAEEFTSKGSRST
jgi:predicted ATP-grasp superfamily ATP-dependent carboligase